MFSPPSIRDVSDLAGAVGRATDLQSAFETLVTELARALDTRVCLFEKVPRGWILVTQVRGGVHLSISDLHVALSSVSPDELTVAVDLRDIGQGVWTSLALKDPEAKSMAVLLAGDWTGLKSILDALGLVLPFALRSVRERESRRRVERLSLDTYTMSRRLSRLGGFDLVCQQAVAQVSRSLGVERVGLALYRPDEDRLVMAATHGYPASVVKDVRIEPGSWVMGHVYTSGRPVVVPDIRQLGVLPASDRPYRTSSFAAVPMFAGTETVGVLSATDKCDGSPFDRHDGAALRTFSASVALALMTARSDTEVHRLSFAATFDSLTGLFNRPYLDARLHQEIERAKRGSSSLTVLLADIDDFKAINDTYGHQIGDAVLRHFGNVLRSTVRVFDVCARYGGDEFAILMPTSDRSTAAACAERIRQRVSDSYANGEDPTPLRRLAVSIGVAVIEDGDAPADLIRRADQCLYQAKGDGKNRVCVNADCRSLGPAPILERNGDGAA